MIGSQKDKSSSRVQEFLLVVILLVALLVVVAFIFWWTQGLLTVETTTNNITTRATTTDKGLVADVLSHRKDLLAIILGAFGAWIGAGAAYFFGRENLRVATNSLLQMKGLTAEQILMQTTVGDLKPRPVPRTFEETSKVDVVSGWFEEDPNRFFAIIADKNGKLLYAVDEEAIYRYMATKPAKLPKENGKPIKGYEEGTSTIAEVIRFVKSQEGFSSSSALHNLIDATTKVNQKSSCALADQKMAEEKKAVAVVVDDNDLPLGFVTPSMILALVSQRRTYS